jgi:hypothetical protein
MRPPFRTLTLLLIVGAAGAARSQGDPCAGYQWDLSKERALFAESGKQLIVGKDRASAGAIVSGRLYALELLPANQVSFPVAPGKDSTSGGYAGIVALSVPSAGKYRIAVDLPLWIDVIAGAKLLSPIDYKGMHGCSTPRKVVVFDLEGSSDWLLQLSAADRAQVRLTVTPVR